MRREGYEESGRVGVRETKEEGVWAIRVVVTLNERRLGKRRETLDDHGGRRKDPFYGIDGRRPTHSPCLRAGHPSGTFFVLWTRCTWTMICTYAPVQIHLDSPPLSSSYIVSS